MIANLPSQYLPILSDDYVYLVYYGGRGGGKSENIAQALILQATQRKERILCARELKSSIKDSVKTLLEKWIEKLNLSDYFRITRDEIIARNGSRFIFKAFSTLSISQIMSMADVNITWFEEADVMSDRSWELGIPSVLRTKTSKVIVSFNPRFESDIVYKTFILNKPPPKSYICKINYLDNPFYEYSNLEYIRVNDFETKPKDYYNHKWLGELVKQAQGALFPDDVLSKMSIQGRYNRDDYTRLVVSCDPATTNKAHSNKFGVIVCGLNKQGLGIILQDCSDLFSPLDFASKINELNEFYKADAVIVETNQGGDFIKHTLLSYNPRLIVKEVRAIKDKVNRAMPIANLCAISKIKLLGDAKEYANLMRQMRLMTTQGFLGASGESPDSVDALVWGMMDLFNLGESAETILKLEWFKQDSSFDFINIKDNVFIATNHRESCVLLFDIVSNVNVKKRILIRDCIICNNTDLDIVLKEFENYTIYAPDIPLFNQYDFNFYEPSKDDLDKQTMSLLGFYKDKIIMLNDSMQDRVYENMQGNLAKLNISRFSLESKDNVCIKALNALLNEFI